MATMHDINEIMDYPEWQQRAYENLANEIVKGMAEEYIGYLLLKGVKYDKDKKFKPPFGDRRGIYLENTLRGDWYNVLTKVDSEYMIQHCQSEAYIRYKKNQKGVEFARYKRQEKKAKPMVYETESMDILSRTSKKGAPKTKKPRKSTNEVINDAINKVEEGFNEDFIIQPDNELGKDTDSGQV